MRGTTLREILACLADRDPDAIARYPLTALLNVFQRVCDAVAFAHSRGISAEATAIPQPGPAGWVEGSRCP